MLGEHLTAIVVYDLAVGAYPTVDMVHQCVFSLNEVEKYDDVWLARCVDSCWKHGQLDMMPPCCLRTLRKSLTAKNIKYFCFVLPMQVHATFAQCDGLSRPEK